MTARDAACVQAQSVREAWIADRHAAKPTDECGGCVGIRERHGLWAAAS